MSTKTLITAAFVFGSILLIFLMVRGCGRQIVDNSKDLQAAAQAKAELERKVKVYQDSFYFYKLKADSFRVVNELNQSKLTDLDKSYQDKSNEVKQLAAIVKNAILRTDTITIVKNAGPLADSSIRLSALYDSIRTAAIASRDQYENELKNRQNMLSALRMQLNTLTTYCDSQAVACAGRPMESSRTELFAIGRTGAFVGVPSVMAGAGLGLRSKGGAFYELSYNRVFNYGDFVQLGYGRRLSLGKHK